ncbi:MAG TPA: Gfo/Idh/MocA family oxidoreductase [Anaerolineae bacterium]|nr:Gfo/Idh/MocA family oxidoreductase [Anaerolineae bacterium]
MDKVGVGVIGCGRISGQYLENLVRRFSFCLETLACADLVPAHAEQRAQEFGIPHVCSVEDLLGDPQVELVVNLTVPAAHFAVTMAALDAGKHVYTEKPLAVTREEGKRLVAKAKERGLLLGGAPDTFLGAGLQTCRKLIDDGWVGTPITAQALIAMGVHVERYHKLGVGPMFDMGPYYVTALVALLGSVKRVSGSAQVPFATKANPDPQSPDYARTYTVDTPTVVSGVLDFESGAVGVVTTTCEVLGYNPRLEVYGTEGILTCNDPNMFGGGVYVQRRGGERREVALTHYYSDRNRGLGVADMAYAIRNGRAPRASGDLMYHVHDVMHGIHDASREERHVLLESRAQRPAPFPAGYTTPIFE